MNIVDSSGWLEYLADGPNADFFAPVIHDLDHLIVPSVSLYEVFKRVLQQRGEGDALQAITIMQQACRIVDLDTTIAIYAAKLSTTFKLPMADSIILATARYHHAVIWTQDRDFKGIENVKYIEKLANHSSSGL